MAPPAECTLAEALADELRVARDDLTHRWLERIAARVNIEPNRIFPTDELLNHVPLLVDGIADYLEDPADEISADIPVIAKAMELGELRYEQGFSAHEILKEYEIMGGVLFGYLAAIADGIDHKCTRGELLACGHRLFRAVAVIQQATTTQFMRLSEERVRERENRLRSFNRTVSHELKNRIGGVVGGAQMLREPWILKDEAQRERFSTIVLSNAEALQSVLEDLLELSRTDGEVRQHRNVELPQAVAEVARQLRELASERKVELRVSPDLPTIEVDAAAVELCLTNFVSNGIKYADPEAEQRWVEVTGRIDTDAPSPRLVIEVRDNGIGVPEDARDRLFDRFYRAHKEVYPTIAGTGLGLSIVRDTVENLGGEAWAEFDQAKGSAFKFSLPCRREMDRT